MILLRHGQSEFNLHFTATRRDPGIVDPRLTELGHAAGRRRRPQRSPARGSRRIIASPYTRALQTAAPIAARARGARCSSIRSCASATPSPATSARRGPSWSATGRSTTSRPSTRCGGRRSRSRRARSIGRAALFRAEMAALPDWSDTLVVSHWGFILSHDRTERDERRVAALRSERTAAGAADLARLTACVGSQDGAAAPSRATRPGRAIASRPRMTRRHLMSETTTRPQPTGQPQTPPLVVNIQYVKDLSFEVPGAPQIYTQLRAQPQVNINLDVQARRVQDGQNVFEVTLMIRAEAHEAPAAGGNGQAADGGRRRVFVAELTYAGVFTLTGLPDNAIEPVLLVECPRILFPFARNILADVTRDGGFPPVLLQPIDFVALWQTRRAQAVGDGRRRRRPEACRPRTLTRRDAGEGLRCGETLSRHAGEGGMRAVTPERTSLPAFASRHGTRRWSCPRSCGR